MSAHQNMARPAPTVAATGSGLTAGSIAAFISFLVFFLSGQPVESVLVWMTTLGLLAFSGTYLGVWLISMLRRS